MPTLYYKLALQGGGPHDMDAIDGAVLEDGDVCICGLGDGTYGFYRLLAAYGGPSLPPEYILPLTNPGLKGWRLLADLGRITNVYLMDGTPDLAADLVGQAYTFGPT